VNPDDLAAALVTFGIVVAALVWVGGVVIITRMYAKGPRK
jgi:hypothetical protein